MSANEAEECPACAGTGEGLGGSCRKCGGTGIDGAGENGLQDDPYLLRQTSYDDQFWGM